MDVFILNAYSVVSRTSAAVCRHPNPNITIPGSVLNDAHSRHLQRQDAHQTMFVLFHLLLLSHTIHFLLFDRSLTHGESLLNNIRIPMSSLYTDSASFVCPPQTLLLVRVASCVYWQTWRVPRKRRSMISFHHPCLTYTSIVKLLLFALCDFI